MDIHPQIVHFAVALMPFAALLDLYALWRGGGAWHQFAYATWVAGLVAAVGAVVSGNIAAAEHWEREGVSSALSTHEDWATAVLLCGLALALGRLPLHLRKAAHGRRMLPWAIGALVGAALVAITAYYGGVLVYEHAVGVRAGG